VTSVLLRRQVGGGAWTNVTQALYTYSATASLKRWPERPSDRGNAGLAERRLDSTGTSYYRYY